MNDNKIIRFEDELKKFIGEYVTIRTISKPLGLKGILISWDFKHQSVIIENNTHRKFIRGSDINTIDYIKEKKSISKTTKIIMEGIKI